jgi:tryptophan synthase alpha chain
VKRLGIFLMAGPDVPALAEAAVEGGADLVEIGFPFSDPLADGPVLRAAAERALAGGMRTERCLEVLSETSRRVDVPLVPMTYASLLETYGYERFEVDARSAGASTLIVADLPADVRPGLRRVHLVAPTSPRERVRMAAERTDGWLYLVAVVGTTGSPGSPADPVEDLVARARSAARVPLLSGFGIATPDRAAAVARVADGVIVGTRAVQVAADGGPGDLRELVSSFRAAVDSLERRPSGR